MLVMLGVAGGEVTMLKSARKKDAQMRGRRSRARGQLEDAVANAIEQTRALSESFPVVRFIPRASELEAKEMNFSRAGPF